MGARSLLAVVLILATTGSAWAEYCRQPGTPVPKKEAARYDRAVLLSPSEVTEAEERHLKWGKPACNRYLYHREFVLCYDTERRVALWVMYELTKADVKKLARRNAFRTDPRLLPDESANCKDYVNTSKTITFDRGHTVPNADMNRSKVAQANTYFLSNMTPQYSRFNQGVWANLEGKVRTWVGAFGSIYVISGSAFDADDDRRPDASEDANWKKPTKRIAIPSHYYKILVRERSNGDLETLAVLLPHVRKGLDDFDKFIEDHLVSIREIRSRTGIQFFPSLVGARREALELAVASRIWPRT
jgi:DNA/RNA endonuclease G (NUC1)